MNKREYYRYLLTLLKSSKNEESVISNITKIIKYYPSNFYKNDLYENPYFRSFIFEIGQKISIELSDIKLTIEKEIESIEIELNKINNSRVLSIENTDIHKLRNLKKECILLIKGLDSRIKDLSLL